MSKKNQKHKKSNLPNQTGVNTVRENEEQLILRNTADWIRSQSSPADYLREMEKITLLNGKEINIDDYVLERFAQYEVHFQRSWYYALADLFHCPRKRMDAFRKPRFVAIFKMQFLYSRFPNAVVNKILSKNKYTGYCKRKYKNFQFLTRTADLKFKQFIFDAQEMMEASSSLQEFIDNYSAKYKISVQLNLFETSESLSNSETQIF